MVGNLSDFFRLSLNKGKETVSIREELSHVRSYLEIQHIRYQDILEYEIKVPEEFYDYLIPKLSVQPIVENALYHGIKNKRGGGKITITGEEKRDHFSIVVEDTGKGMPLDKLREIRKAIREGNPEKNVVYGLYNVNERIRLNFGEGYGVHIESLLDKGTRVVIRLPKKTAG